MANDASVPMINAMNEASTATRMLTYSASQNPCVVQAF